MSPLDFPSTQWTELLRARRKGRNAAGAMLERYRLPVTRFIEHLNCSRDEAEDLAQEVFYTLIRGKVLDKLDRGRGRFRSLLMAVSRNVVAAWRRQQGRWKRGRGFRRLRLDEEELAELWEQSRRTVPTPEDRAFDHLWIENLLQTCVRNLQEESRREENPYYRAFQLRVFRNLSYAAIARRLRMKVEDVTNHLHQARRRLKRFVLSEVRRYAVDRTAYEEEIAYLRHFLDSSIFPPRKRKRTS